MGTQLLTDNTVPAARLRLIFRRLFPYILFCLIAVYAGFILLYHLDRWPKPWFDDGSYLKVAKNYARNGVYADYSSEGSVYTGAIVAVGPTVILPVALVFKLGGVSILAARLTMVGYSLGTLLALWGLCQGLWHKAVAYLAVLLLLLTPAFIEYGRQMMGEVPGLGLLLAGLAVWGRAGKRHLGGQVGAGVLFGLACITKNQYAVIILPALAGALVLEVVWYRQRAWRWYIVPGLVAGALFVGWTYYLFFGLDRALRDIPAEQALLRATTNGAFFRVDLIQNIGNFLSISHSGAGIFLIPTLLYHLLQHRRNPERLHRTLPMFVMLILAVGLYVFSIGWERYAFPVWGLFIPYLAAMLVEIAAQIPVRLRDWRTRLASEGLTGSLLTGIVLTGMMIQVIAFPLFKQAYTVYSNNADDVYRLAQYLNTNAKPDALIETWEHEIAVLTNHKYHFPPTFAMIASTKDIEGAKVYDFRDYVNPDYVIIGPFALNKSVYTADRLVNYDLVKTAGMYKVYAKRAGVG